MEDITIKFNNKDGKDENTLKTVGKRKGKEIMEGEIMLGTWRNMIGEAVVGPVS